MPNRNGRDFTREKREENRLQAFDKILLNGGPRWSLKGEYLFCLACMSFIRLEVGLCLEQIICNSLFHFSTKEVKTIPINCENTHSTNIKPKTLSKGK